MTGDISFEEIKVCTT